MSEKFSLSDNKAYWEDPDTISIIDKNLHQLEMAFVSKYLAGASSLMDVGCGNGMATIHYASQVDRCIGIERSDHLRALAADNLRASGLTNLRFVSGDVLNLSQVASDEGLEEIDVAVTQRMLINLPSWELQKQAIDEIHRCLKPGGYYVMIENTWDGQDNLSACRQQVGLDPIKLHWHNEYIDFQQLQSGLQGRFELVERQGFNLYYFLTRVYCQMFASFTGFGKQAKADPIFAVADEAARKLQETLGDVVLFDGMPVVGPIQGMAWRKVA